MYVAGFAPIEAGVRDEDFNSAEEQGEKAEGGDPMSDTDERGVPRTDRSDWDGGGGSCGPSGIAHSGMLSGVSAAAQGGVRSMSRHELLLLLEMKVQDAPRIQDKTGYRAVRGSLEMDHAIQPLEVIRR